VTQDLRRVVVLLPGERDRQDAIRRQQQAAAHQRVVLALESFERLPHVQDERRRQAVAWMDAEVQAALAVLVSLR
jgi:hypothetical protein